MDPITLLANCTPAELVPPHEKLSLHSFREIQLLGPEGVQQLIRRWRAFLRNVDEHLSFIEKMADPPNSFGLNSVGLRLEGPYRELSCTQHSLRKCLPNIQAVHKQIKAKIDQLLLLRKYAERAPLLPQLRPSDWFKVGEDVVVCTKDRVYRGVYERLGDLGAEIRVGPGADDTVIAGLAVQGLRLPWEHELLTTNQEIAQFWQEKAR
jgi:hypothetical protein